MKLVAEPHIPFALWLTLAIVALAAMVWYGLSNKMSATRRQKALILGLMSLALTLPLLVLLNLTWIQNVPPPGGKPVIRILIDSSASMATPDTKANLESRGLRNWPRKPPAHWKIGLTFEFRRLIRL